MQHAWRAALWRHAKEWRKGIVHFLIHQKRDMLRVAAMDIEACQEGPIGGSFETGGGTGWQRAEVYGHLTSAAAEAVTLWAASGAVVHLFPTGQGNVVGNPVVPVRVNTKVPLVLVLLKEVRSSQKN